MLPPTPNPTRHVQLLDELIAMGTDLARQLHVQATAYAAAQPAAPEAQRADQEEAQAAHRAALSIAIAATGRATEAFDRVARCIRRTIALVQHLESPPKPAIQAPSRAQARAQARARIIRSVEDAITLTARHTSRPGDIDTESLAADLRERLDDPALDTDIATRPIDAVITEICRDLGLCISPAAQVWRRRTQADIEALRADAEAPPGALRIRPPRPAQQRPPLPQPEPAPPGIAALMTLCTRLAPDG